MIEACTQAAVLSFYFYAKEQREDSALPVRRRLYGQRYRGHQLTVGIVTAEAADATTSTLGAKGADIRNDAA